MINFTLNGKEVSVDAPDDTPLLWVLRDDLRLTGTKFGCGIAQCGACTVRVDGRAVRSCVTPVSSVSGQEVQTIEGLAPAKDTRHALQRAWIEHQVPQCGYCQSGQLMSAAALLDTNPDPSDEDIDRAMEGNLCRCGAHTGIVEAVLAARTRMDERSDDAKSREAAA